MGGVKNKWGSNIYYYITTLSFFHFFRNSNTQKSEAFLLRFSLGNVNLSVVTCRYPQIYNFSFRKEILETLLGYLSGILTAISKTSFVKNSPTSCVSSL